MDGLLEHQHLALRGDVRAFARSQLAEVDAQAEALEVGPGDARARQEAVDAHAVATVRALGKAGMARLATADDEGGGIDSRSLCIVREEIAWASGMADTLVAMQGLGSYPVALAGAGRDATRRQLLRGVADGSLIGAFAITEEGAGSDVGALTTRAVADGGDYVLTGAKTFISNAGIADFYVVFARTGEGSKGLTAFLVEARTAGLTVPRRIPVNAAHPIGELRLDGVRVPASARLGAEGEGFKLAMATLDRYRPSVGAAALGFAQRALDETLTRVRARVQFGKPLAEFQATQLRIAEMATLIEASRGLVYRAARLADVEPARRSTKEASMAKLFATESAQRVVDDAVQLHGGTGVVRGVVVERLYREVRALRIYEGTSEIQKLVIARELLRPPVV